LVPGIFDPVESHFNGFGVLGLNLGIYLLRAARVTEISPDYKDFLAV
jgi:hypothetical protein